MKENPARANNRHSEREPGLAERIRRKALELGFDGVGFCTADPFDDWSAQAWDALKHSVHADPAELLPGARALVVAFRRYRVYEDWPEGYGRVANFYPGSNEGYRWTKDLAEYVAAQGWRVLANPALPAKRAALRTGLGFQGWNTQFCHRELGVLVSIHLVLTDAPLPAAREARAVCAGCGRCAALCPTGAITAEGCDRHRCLRYHMIGAEPVPLGLREKMGASLVGCTVCQHACPHARMEIEPIPEELLRACELGGLLEGDRAQIRTLARFIGPNFARKQRIVAQAALCAGNSGNRDYVPRLAALLARGNPVQRGHAAWALGRLGGEGARRALEERLPAEKEAAVAGEIRAALEGLQAP